MRTGADCGDQLGVPLSEPLDRLVDTARLCAFVLLAFAGFGILLPIFGPPEYRAEQVLFMLSMIIGHGLPAILFLILWRWMARGRSTAFYLMIALTTFCLIKQTIGSLMLCLGDADEIAFAMAVPMCGPVQFLFLSYIAARCVIAWPEVRDLRRHERRQYFQPGFPVQMTPPRPPPPPPPPARRTG